MEDEKVTDRESRALNCSIQLVVRLVEGIGMTNCLRRKHGAEQRNNRLLRDLQMYQRCLVDLGFEK